MYKPTHTESDYTAEYLGHRVHEGSSKTRSKRSSDRRGRKPKKGRIIRKFKIHLRPNRLQEGYLQMDLDFFNEVYTYTLSRLSEGMHKATDGFYHGYDVKNQRPTALQRRSKNVVPHTPKYIMDQQNLLIEENDWMQGCTYQVSYRATIHAFKDKVADEMQREFKTDGNTYEAKICYRLVNGFLYLKKFDQYIQIKETLPKGGLESIRITKEEDGWSAIIEILEPFDKAQDIRESRKGVLETDTKKVEVYVNSQTEQLLITKARFFKSVANSAILDKMQGEPLVDKMRHYQNENRAASDLDLVNMACVAANAREYKYRKTKKPPLIAKEYIAISEGYYISGDTLVLKKWGISLPMYGTFRTTKFDYIVLQKSKEGSWVVSGKKRKRNIFRNLSRLYREFSWKDNILF